MLRDGACNLLVLLGDELRVTRDVILFETQLLGFCGKAIARGRMSKLRFTAEGGCQLRAFFDAALQSSSELACIGERPLECSALLGIQSGALCSHRRFVRLAGDQCRAHVLKRTVQRLCGLELLRTNCIVLLPFHARQALTQCDNAVRHATVFIGYCTQTCLDCSHRLTRATRRAGELAES